MDESESIATAITAINSVSTRFSPLPSIVYYENAFNLVKSVALRFRWMFSDTTFVCDRLHYAFDPDTHPCCDNIPTSGAEAINKQWGTSRKHIRFLSADNIVPFLYVRMLFLNIRAHLRHKTKGVDVENQDVIQFADDLLACTCERCSLLNKSKPGSDKI